MHDLKGRRRILLNVFCEVIIVSLLQLVIVIKKNCIFWAIVVLGY